MKIQFAEGFPGDEASGAIGPFAYHHKRAEMPAEVEDTMGEALLRTTWRKRTETPVEGQAKPKVSYSDEPVFARVEDEAVLTADPKSEVAGTLETIENVGEGEQLRPLGLEPVRRRARQ